MGTSTDQLTPVIRLRDVSVAVGHDRTVVLSNLTLDVRSDEVLSIVGRSGAGKSTLLRVLAGLVDVADGAIEHTGVGPQRTAVVFQDSLLLPWLTVVENVAFSFRLAGHPRRLRRRPARASAAAEVLERLDIAELANRYPSELSGGQQQRVSIARAVAARPDVLLLDEPFSALDLATRSALQDWIVDHRSSLAPTIVLVTHDLSEALYVADRIALLSPGGDATTLPIWTSDVHDRWQLEASSVRTEIESHFLPASKGLLT
jgi:ABC-type nitrate/sulfonate/bicarbonate transport system ATPase subunit